MIARTYEELAEIEDRLRDKYAMAALTGILSNENVNPIKAIEEHYYDLLAAGAYRMADAMLDLRDKDTSNITKFDPKYRGEEARDVE